MEWLILWFGLAVAAGVIASSKNRSGFGYFVLGFLLPLIGVIIAIGVSSLPKPSGPVAHWREKKCPACAETILKEAKKCKHCGEVFG